MIDQSFCKKLKQNDIAHDPEKVKLRLREIWKNNMAKRNEILDLAGIKKITVERSYKKGTISAKLAIAIAQILNIDPNYMTGHTDEPGEYSYELLVGFLERYHYKHLIEELPKPKRKYTSRKPKVSLVNTITAESDTTDSNETVKPDINIESDGNAEPTDNIQSNDNTDINDTVVSSDSNDSEISETIEIAEEAESESTPIIELVKDKLETPSESEREYLNSLTEEDINLLLKSLMLRARYYEDARMILDLVKTLLIG